jgi:hypothetical protein
MNLTMLVKTLDSGQVEASVLEFPGCRIEASSRDIAIPVPGGSANDQLRTTLIDRLQDTELLSFEIPINLANPWVKLFGLFKEDPYFDDVVNIMQADRNALGDEEIDPAYYS